MLAFLIRRKASILIWQYLDGIIPPDRFDLLQRLLSKHSSIRQQFVDCAVLNALLFAHFNPGRYSAVPAMNGQPQRLEDPADAGSALQAELDQIEADAAAQHDDEPHQRRTKRPAG